MPPSPAARPPPGRWLHPAWTPAGWMTFRLWVQNCGPPAGSPSRPRAARGSQGQRRGGRVLSHQPWVGRRQFSPVLGSGPPMARRGLWVLPGYRPKGRMSLDTSSWELGTQQGQDKWPGPSFQAETHQVVCRRKRKMAGRTRSSLPTDQRRRNTTIPGMAGSSAEAQRAWRSPPETQQRTLRLPRPLWHPGPPQSWRGMPSSMP